MSPPTCQNCGAELSGSPRRCPACGADQDIAGTREPSQRESPQSLFSAPTTSRGTLADADDGFVAWIRRGFFVALGFWLFTLVVAVVVGLLFLAGCAALIAGGGS